jgi:hypothetical protein
LRRPENFEFDARVALERRSMEMRRAIALLQKYGRDVSHGGTGAG